MKVSVLVPVYNLGRFIEPCLLSLLEQQTNFDFEVIAIDDGSSDDSWAIMQRLAQQWPQLKALQNSQNMGLAKTQKRLLREATGEYIAYVDGDDLALPGKLQSQADYLDLHTDCTLCYHEAEMFDDETGARIKLFTRDYYNARYFEPVMTREALIRFGVFVNASSIMFRRYEGMENAIDEGCKIILDYPWHILNLSHNPGTLDFIPELLGRYRFHTQSFGGQTRKSAERREQSLRDLLRACDNAAAFGEDPVAIAQGRAHHYYSAALYFLRQDDVARFTQLIEQSVAEVAELAPGWFFDERHQLAWMQRAHPARVMQQLFGEAA
ncbi:glycosyltransferase family 2 protein [Aeromonas veronii]|uniref:glycosyltransferase family 2 protein n=1 Tax=Aeromonas veronii TaxID=654 RepID=UPI001115AF84|nr:glycosyltransferase family A protein [Aeromonas veronii]TNI51822.1 glycosyl transferase [Aeromonas veronii]TNI54719.1 glycosyl transferase [Aeromonas veronii]TNJ03019.1 glycosyl transferase [Aeromonas veronii]